LRDRVARELDRYSEGAIAEDDITLVLRQFDPAQAPSQQVPGRGAA